MARPGVHENEAENARLQVAKSAKIDILVPVAFRLAVVSLNRWLSH